MSDESPASTATLGTQPGQPVMPPGGVALTPAPSGPTTLGQPGPPPVGATPPAGAGTPSPSPAAGPANRGDARPDPEPGRAAVAEPAAPPAWPEKFLREGKPDPEALLQSYRELERKQFQRREDLRTELRNEATAEARKDVPASPADYEFVPVTLKGGMELNVDRQSPLFQFFATTAHELGIPQSKFQELVGQFAMANFASAPSWESESAKLGPQAEQRLGRAGAWGRGHLSQQAYDAFAKIPATAETIMLFEEIMELAGEPKFAISQAGTVKESLSKADIEEMMKDPRYWHDSKRDAQFVARVKAGLRKLTGTRSQG